MYHGTFSAKQFKIFLLSPDYILRIGNVTVYYTNEFKYLLNEAKAKVGSILDLVVRKVLLMSVRFVVRTLLPRAGNIQPRLLLL